MRKIILTVIILIISILIVTFATIKLKSSLIIGYRPFQIKQAYGLNKFNSKGENHKIAIIVPYGSYTIEEDLEIFSNKFNLDQPNLQVYYPQGKPVRQNYSWALETSLDVEWVHALAPQSSILLIVAKSDSTNDLIAAVDYATTIGATIVSMSWAINEFKEEVSYEHHFENKNTIFIASTGNNGAEVNWPAVSPNVLAVGGTTFSLDSKGQLNTPETGWIESGGGISKYMLEPKYQRDYGINTNGYRAIPDVSFYADSSKGVAVYCSPRYGDQTGWTTSAGTSLGAPAWAAFLALVNEDINTAPVSNIHEKLYKLAKDEQQYSIDFRDIMIGENNLYKTEKGYDYVTGLGSPLGKSPN